MVILATAYRCEYHAYIDREAVSAMANIHDTQIQLLEIVLPGHSNSLGTLHGGQMMGWLVNAGSLAAMRVAKGPVVLGAIDNVNFLNPVLVNQIVALEAQVEYIGASSTEVGANALSEDPETGQRRPTTSCHMAFVAVDNEGHPRPVQTSLKPKGARETEIYEAANTRRLDRRAQLADHRRLEGTHLDNLHSPLGWEAESVRPVLPEEATHSNLMNGGRLLKYIDELGGIPCRRYTRGVCVTASLNAMSFYQPIRVGDILVMKAVLERVGRTSLKVGVKVLVERPWKDEIVHACTAFLTYVHLGEDRRPQPVPRQPS